MTVTSNKRSLNVKDFSDFEIINSFFLIEDSFQKFLALVDGDRVVGCVTYTTGLEGFSRGTATILRLEIKENYRSCGYGTGLLKLALDDIFSHKEVKKVTLMAVPTATLFYRKIGFKFLSKKTKIMVLKKRWLTSTSHL